MNTVIAAVHSSIVRVFGVVQRPKTLRVKRKKIPHQQTRQYHSRAAFAVAIYSQGWERDADAGKINSIEDSPRQEYREELLSDVQLILFVGFEIMPDSIEDDELQPVDDGESQLLGGEHAFVDVCVDMRVLIPHNQALIRFVNRHDNREWVHKYQ